MKHKSKPTEKKHRVVLIQVDSDSPSAKPFSVYNVAEPLGLLSVASTLETVGTDVLVLHKGIIGNRLFTHANVIAKIIEFRPTLVAFSCMTKHVLESHAIACSVKELLPEIKTIVGGDHFSSMPEDILHFSAFDLAVRGEGEACMDWLVNNLDRMDETALVPEGIYWKEGKTIHGSGTARRVGNLDGLPRVKRYQSLIRTSYVGSLMNPPPSKQTGMVSVFASRGCPFNCSYCDATQVWGRRVAWRSPAVVVDELRDVAARFHANTAFFVDLTFNSNRKNLLRLCHDLSKASLGVSWYALVRPGVHNTPLHVDREVLQSMQEAGCTKIGFGVETISEAVSAELNRRKGMDELLELCRMADSIGLLTKAFFIMGHPVENDAYYDELASYFTNLSADEIRLSFLTPFPGTALWRKYRHVLPGQERYDCFDTFTPLIPHDTYTSNELQKIRIELLRGFYRSECYVQHIKKKVDEFPELRKSFEEFFGVIETELGIPSIETHMRERSLIASSVHD